MVNRLEYREKMNRLKAEIKRQKALQAQLDRHSHEYLDSLALQTKLEDEKFELMKDVIKFG